jgi:hypothetical protein
LSRRCPGVLLFSLRLPSSYVEDGVSWKLPPSFEPNIVKLYPMFVKAMYTLSISLTRVIKCPVLPRTKHKT